MEMKNGCVSLRSVSFMVVIFHFHKLWEEGYPMLFGSKLAILCQDSAKHRSMGILKVPKKKLPARIMYLKQKHVDNKFMIHGDLLVDLFFFPLWATQFDSE